MVLTAAKRPVVLIVEDETLLRMHAVEMIEEAGFDIVAAGNADEAISALEIRSDISVVFTDIQMPGLMDGLKLAAAVRDRWPPIKIIATSGRCAIREGDPRTDCSFQSPTARKTFRVCFTNLQAPANHPANAGLERLALTPRSSLDRSVMLS